MNTTQTKRPFATTAKCPDGTFYGAAWNADGSLIAMSEGVSSRAAARSATRRAFAVQARHAITRALATRSARECLLELAYAAALIELVTKGTK